VLDSPITASFTAYAAVIMPDGRMRNASDLKTALRPVVVDYPGLGMPFDYRFLSIQIPKRWPKGEYGVAAAFFDPSKPVTVRSDALLDARATFIVH
jgi:hypothetical protein